MADKTSVLITIENGAASVAVFKGEAPGALSGGFEPIFDTPAPFGRFFIEEEEACIRFAANEHPCCGYGGFPFGL